MYKRVFISYATEDFKYADSLYNFLNENGFEPWMDKKNLLPGQNWDFIIQQELRKSDFIILLLSDISVTKRGYVQKEFSQALTYCEEKLDSDIYIIPILINSCNVPSKLSRFQWLEYSSKDSFEKILTSINTQRDCLIKEKREREARIAGFGYIEKTLRGEYGEKSPKQLYEIVYPVFNNVSIESLHEANITIENEIINHLKGARTNYFEYLKDYDVNYTLNGDSTLYGRISFQFLSKHFLSYTSYWSYYITGAFHGNYYTTGHNLFLNPLRNFNFESLFFDFTKALPILTEIINNKLMDKARKEFNISKPSDFYLCEEGLTADKENFENYYFKNNSIVFIYNTYHLTAYALGDHHPEIPFDELINKFPNETKLIDFIKITKTEDNY